MTDNDPLDTELERALRAQAPARLAADVLARLVVARAARRRVLRRTATGATVAALMFTGLFLARPAPASAERPTHMLAIHEQLADRLALAPAERQRQSREFGVWVQELRARRMLVGGQQLTTDGGYLISTTGVDDRSGGIPVGEVVSGFLLVQAENEEDVLRAAGSCPILEHGGRVSVRRIAR
jgi:hypothetical protein